MTGHRFWAAAADHDAERVVQIAASLAEPGVAPDYRAMEREVSLVLRDARSARVVYETQASHDGPWADNPTLWAALLDAALQGFPQAPAGPRRVVIEVPR